MCLNMHVMTGQLHYNVGVSQKKYCVKLSLYRVSVSIGKVKSVFYTQDRGKLHAYHLFHYLRSLCSCCVFFKLCIMDCKERSVVGAVV